MVQGTNVWVYERWIYVVYMYVWMYGCMRGRCTVKALIKAPLQLRDP